MRIVCTIILIWAVMARADDAPKSSPLDRLDAKKLPAKFKPPMSAPPQTLAMIGLRDGRWDTIVVRPDAKLIAASDPQTGIQLWSVPDFKPTAKLNHPQVVALAFSNIVLAAGDAKGNLRLWTLTTPPTARATLTGIHKNGPLWSLAFAPDGKTLATAGADGVIKLWDVKMTKPVLKATIKAHEKIVRQLAFSPDGKHLASAGSTDKVAKLWDVSEAKPAEKAVLKCDGPVASVSFAPDGKTLATSSYDGKVRLWKLGDTPEIDQTIEMPKKSVRLVQFAPDGQSLAALLLDEQAESITIRDRTGQKLADLDFNHHIQAMTFADAHHLLTANEDSIYVIRFRENK